MKKKLNKGDTVVFQQKTWTVCDGGRSDPKLKSFRYKIMRGSWKKLVQGNRISRLQTA